MLICVNTWFPQGSEGDEARWCSVANMFAIHINDLALNIKDCCLGVKGEDKSVTVLLCYCLLTMYKSNSTLKTRFNRAILYWLIQIFGLMSKALWVLCLSQLAKLCDCLAQNETLVIWDFIALQFMYVLSVWLCRWCLGVWRKKKLKCSSFESHEIRFRCAYTVHQ